MKPPRDLRVVYQETMHELLGQNPDIVLLEADLSSAITTNKIDARFSNRIINCGIQEANMMGVAAGLNVSGLKPYVHSFAPFVSRRAYDQVFLSIGYAKRDVFILGSDGGISTEHNGGTHMSFEDIALMRAIPGSTVLEMSDDIMFEHILKQSLSFKGLTYVRIKRRGMKRLYPEDATFEIGKGNVIKDGCDATIIATGIMLEEVLNAHEQLKAHGIDAAIIDMFSIKPIDKSLLFQYAEKTGLIITAENHNLVGGLFSAVTEALSPHKIAIIDGIGVKESFGQVGLTPYLKETYHLTAEAIVKKVLSYKNH